MLSPVPLATLAAAIGAAAALLRARRQVGRDASEPPLRSAEDAVCLLRSLPAETTDEYVSLLVARFEERGVSARDLALWEQRIAALADQAGEEAFASTVVYSSMAYAARRRSGGGGRKCGRGW